MSQRIETRDFKPHARASLVLEHVQVFAHGILERGITTRVGQSRPEGARHIARFQVVDPQLGHRQTAFRRLEGLDLAHIPGFEFGLHQLGKLAAARSLSNRTRMHLVVIGHRLRA